MKKIKKYIDENIESIDQMLYLILLIEVAIAIIFIFRTEL